MKHIEVVAYPATNESCKGPQFNISKFLTYARINFSKKFTL